MDFFILLNFELRFFSLGIFDFINEKAHNNSNNEVVTVKLEVEIASFQPKTYCFQ